MVTYKDFGVKSAEEFRKKYGSSIEDYRTTQITERVIREQPEAARKILQDEISRLRSIGATDITINPDGSLSYTVQTISKSGIAEPLNAPRRGIVQTKIEPVVNEYKIDYSRGWGQALPQQRPRGFQPRTEQQLIEQAVVDYEKKKAEQPYKTSQQLAREAYRKDLSERQEWVRKNLLGAQTDPRVRENILSLVPAGMVAESVGKGASEYVGGLANTGAYLGAGYLSIGKKILRGDFEGVGKDAAAMGAFTASGISKSINEFGPSFEEKGRAIRMFLDYGLVAKVDPEAATIGYMAGGRELGGILAATAVTGAAIKGVGAAKQLFRGNEFANAQTTALEMKGGAIRETLDGLGLRSRSFRNGQSVVGPTVYDYMKENLKTQREGGRFLEISKEGLVDLDKQIGRIQKLKQQVRNELFNFDKYHQLGGELSEVGYNPRIKSEQVFRPKFRKAQSGIVTVQVPKVDVSKVLDWTSGTVEPLLLQSTRSYNPILFGSASLLSIARNKEKTVQRLEDVRITAEKTKMKELTKFQTLQKQVLSDVRKEMRLAFPELVTTRVQTKQEQRLEQLMAMKQVEIEKQLTMEAPPMRPRYPSATRKTLPFRYEIRRPSLGSMAKPRKGKKIKLKKATYAPSLGGYLSGKTIKKAPKYTQLTGFETRYPIEKDILGGKKRINIYTRSGKNKSGEMRRKMSRLWRL